jgi:SAM-dependent methyltransferase
MHPSVYREFERVCAAHHRGDSVLEVGAVPGGDSLLRLAAFRAARTRVGVSLEGAYRGPDLEIFRGNANDLSRFPEASFDTVVSNATLEHDPFFWKTLSEMKRVLRPGGLLVIGVPGFARLRLDRLVSLFDKLNPFRFLLAGRGTFLGSSTVSLRVHEFPGDYYRFSEQAVREVFLAGMREVEVRRIMVPPRIIGRGRKPGR